MAAAQLQRMAARGTWVLVAGGFHRGGGMDAANFALAAYLADRGYRVHLVSHRVADALRAHEMIEVHPVRRVAGSFFLGQWLIDQRGQQVAAAVRAADPSARVIVNGGNCNWPDINWVHYVHHAWRDGASGARFAPRLKTRLVNSVARTRERIALRGARVVIANSERTRRDLVNLIGLPAARVRTVYLGAEPHWRGINSDRRATARNWLGRPSDRPLAAFIGSLGTDSRKGLDTVWQAWQQLCAHPDWDADLVVAGGGRSLPAWRARIAAAGLGERIVVVGHTDRVPEVLAAADLLISPARYEPYGLSVHEALCCGVPALVAAGAGIAERYPAELGEWLLADPDDVQALVRKLVQWRAAPDAWKQRVRPLARELRTRTWEAMAREIEQTALEFGRCG